MLEPGEHVKLHSLGARAELNGRRGVIRHFMRASGRYAVDVDGEPRTIALKPANLKHFEAPREEMPPEVFEEACSRVALASFVPGDRVQGASGKEGALLSVTHRLARIRPADGGDTEECLLRDCTLRLPTGRPRGAPGALVRRSVELCNWPEQLIVDSYGRWRLGRSESGACRERDGVHWLRLVGTSDAVPACVRVASVTLELQGMDQGWGNSGDSGVLLSLLRTSAHSDDESPHAAAAEREAVLDILFDRGRQRSRAHRACLEVDGPFAPRAGDRFQVWLRCPSYPGWSADCEKARVSVACDVHADAASAPPSAYTLPQGWEASATSAFVKLWEALSSGAAADAYLEVDDSHMSLEGLRQQGVCQDHAQVDPSSVAAPRPAATLPARLASLVSAARRRCQAHLGDGSLGDGSSAAAAPHGLAEPDAHVQGAMALMERLARESGGGDGVSAAATARACRCSVVAHATLDALELPDGALGALPAAGLAEGMIALVCRHWSEAAEHCAYRWERELEMMLDLVSGRPADGGGVHAPAEDQLLRRLLEARRQMAEAELHLAKGATQTDDMHFESYFYSEVAFGLPEQQPARRDPNRLTYARHALTSFEPTRVAASLWSRYSPRAICAIVRRTVFESSSEGAAELREKIVDWLAAHVPPGLLTTSPMADRRSTWLHTYCHDVEYVVTDAALLYALCGMHVLRVRPLLPSPSLAPSEVPPPPAAAQVQLPVQLPPAAAQGARRPGEARAGEARAGEARAGEARADRRADGPAGQVEPVWVWAKVWACMALVVAYMAMRWAQI